MQPEIAAQLHPTKNGVITAKELTTGSKKKVWWKCTRDERHEWIATPYARVIGQGCAVCRGLQVQVGVNDLESQFPAVAKQWHPTKNGLVQPDEYSFGSGFKAWWLCDKGHEWQIAVTARTNGAGCPFCSNRYVLTGFNDLETANPELAKEWHPTKNQIPASGVQAGSRSKVWWLCEKGHEWEAQVEPRHTRKVGCPYCTGKRPVQGENDLSTTWPQVAAQWHPSKNGALKPTEVSAKSEIKIWWLCDTGHEWQSAPATRGNDCPICTNRKLLSGFNDFATLEPELTKQLHPTMNGLFNPAEVSVGSEKKVWWLCEKGHEWQTGFNVRRMGRGCPICSNNIVQLGVNDLATTRPDLASEWHPNKNGALRSTDVVAGTSKRIWWLCAQGHEWETTGNYRVIDNSGCPGCAVRGYDATAPGLLYFLHHKEFAARKVGITNSNIKTDRLAGFTSLGWKVIKTWRFPEGNTPQALERKFFRWLRKEKHLPQFLGKQEMAVMGGHSETFSESGISDKEVIDYIEALVASQRKTGK